MGGITAGGLTGTPVGEPELTAGVTIQARLTLEIAIAHVLSAEVTFCSPKVSRKGWGKRYRRSRFIASRNTRAFNPLRGTAFVEFGATLDTPCVAGIPPW